MQRVEAELDASAKGEHEMSTSRRHWIDTIGLVAAIGAAIALIALILRGHAIVSHIRDGLAPVRESPEAVAASVERAFGHMRLGAGLIILALAGVTDLRHRKIPNTLVVAGIAAGIMLGLVAADYREFLWDLAVATILLIVFALTAARGWMGYGDVKLMAVLPLVMGWRPAVTALAYGYIAGGLYAVAYLIYTRRFLSLLQRRGADDPPRERIMLPLAPFLFAGALAALVAP